MEVGGGEGGHFNPQSGRGGSDPMTTVEDINEGIFQKLQFGERWGEV